MGDVAVCRLLHGPPEHTTRKEHVRTEEEEKEEEEKMVIEAREGVAEVVVRVWVVVIVAAVAAL